MTAKRGDSKSGIPRPTEICELCGRDIRPLMARLGRSAVWSQHLNAHRAEALQTLYQKAHAVAEISGELHSTDAQVEAMRAALAMVDKIEDALAAIEKGR